MKGNRKKLLCMALACLLCWTIPAQALTAAELPKETEQTETVELPKETEQTETVELPEDTEQTETAQLEDAEQPEEDNSVSDSDILEDIDTPLLNDDSAKELIVIEDANGMVYQEGGTWNSCLGSLWYCHICGDTTG